MKYIQLIICLLALVVSTGCSSNETFVIKEINLEMVKCPSGSFMMGSPQEEYTQLKNMIGNSHKKWYGFEYEEKLHLVTISKPFYIGKYEVTQSQYVALMGKNPSKFICANNPVESITYDDAKNFCEKLNLKYLNVLPQGYKFDLPTEAQWEYACRAGTNTALNNGKNLTTSDGVCPNLDEVAWYDKNASSTTHIVGQKKPNNWGVYDMHGNVWELCQDFYGEYPNENAKDPKGANTGTDRVNRGGGCNFIAIGCRSALRYHNDPKSYDQFVGFRVALVPIE